MPRHTDQRTRATQVAHEGIRDLPAAGIATAAVQLVLAHADLEDARDLLTGLFMMVNQNEETRPHGHARS